MNEPTFRRAGSGELPPRQLRAQIADAVHEVIYRNYGPMPGLCVLYAHVGAIVASLLTGVRYHPQFGSLYVDLAEGPEGRVFAHEAADGGFGRREFHSWFAAEHSDGRVELVDLASRFYADWVVATMPGAQRPVVPPFIWNWHSQIPANVALVTDLQTCLDAERDKHQQQDLWERSKVLASQAVRVIDETKKLAVPEITIMVMSNEAVRVIDAHRPSVPKQAPVTAGRNDRCPCGSGRKFKKCCLGDVSEVQRSTGQCPVDREGDR